MIHEQQWLKRVVFSQVVVMSGMRAAIRSTTLSALSKGWRCSGFMTIIWGCMRTGCPSWIVIVFPMLSIVVGHFLVQPVFQNFSTLWIPNTLCLQIKSNTDIFVIFLSTLYRLLQLLNNNREKSCKLWLIKLCTSASKESWKNGPA